METFILMISLGFERKKNTIVAQLKQLQAEMELIIKMLEDQKNYKVNAVN